LSEGPREAPHRAYGKSAPGASNDHLETAVEKVRKAEDAWNTAKQPGDLACGAVLGDMLPDKELDQIVDAVCHEASAGVLFLRSQIASLSSYCKYLQSCRTSLVQRDTAIRPDVYLRRRRSAPRAR
jgi:hypothetical protein